MFKSSIPTQRPVQRYGLSWFGIIRLGLVQASLGAIVVLTTSIMNRILVVEIGLAAMIPGILVGLHYAVQIGRPLWGHAADVGGNRTRWIIGGFALLALAGTLAATAPILFEWSFWAGMLVGIAAYTLIGFGIGACGTSLLALLASRTAPDRRAAAATTVWIMMIVGIIFTSIAASIVLDPYSHTKLLSLTAIAASIALALVTVSISGVERRFAPMRERPASETINFREAFSDAWRDPHARLFTIFVFVSMLSYATQDLILEPFGGLLFDMTPGETTALNGQQHSGVLVGMLLVGIAGSVFKRWKSNLLKGFTVVGCVGSGLALAALAFASSTAPQWPLELNVMLLGFMNGMFAVAAIGTMMTLASNGDKSREGIRMGLWGAAQAIAFGLGGFAGTVILDAVRWMTDNIALSFTVVFSVEALLFLASAIIALRINYSGTRANERERPTVRQTEPFHAQPAE
ncbi:MAG: BCD family MFS transporter [Pseudomonadota bacterium]